MGESFLAWKWDSFQAEALAQLSGVDMSSPNDVQSRRLCLTDEMEVQNVQVDGFSIPNLKQVLYLASYSIGLASIFLLVEMLTRKPRRNHAAIKRQQLMRRRLRRARKATADSNYDPQLKEFRETLGFDNNGSRLSSSRNSYLSQVVLPGEVDRTSSPVPVNNI